MTSCIFSITYRGDAAYCFVNVLAGCQETEQKCIDRFKHYKTAHARTKTQLESSCTTRRFVRE
jgi:hypothetical protein